MLKKTLAYLQYILPVNLYTRLNGKISDSRIQWFKNWQIRRYIKKHKVNMDRFLDKDINHYPTFNEFFIRRLNPKFMATCQLNEIVSPAEAAITYFGQLSQNTLIQAKNKTFTLQSLLANDKELTKQFENGAYLILYLEPHNYHRFHMPFTGQLTKTIYVPGKLFAVDFEAQEIVTNLYAKNERYMTFFDTAIGKMGIVLIGALSVGRIKTVWRNTPVRANKIVTETYNSIKLEKNAELGFFQAGSTIILLFEPEKITWKNNLAINTPIPLGQAIGDVIHPY